MRDGIGRAHRPVARGLRLSVRRGSLLFLALFVAFGASARAMRDPSRVFFNTHNTNLADIAREARAAGKVGVLIMFEQQRDPWSTRMRRNALSKPSVQAYYRKLFVNIHLDIHANTPLVDFSGVATTPQRFAVTQRIRATPTFVFYNVDGRPMVRFTGATYDAAEFLRLGEYVASGAYLKKSFSAFEREKRRRR